MVDSEQEIYVWMAAFESFVYDVLAQIRTFHKETPYQIGMPTEAFRGKLAANVPEKLLAFTISWLVEKGDVIQEKDRVRLPDHQIRLSGEDETLRNKILDILNQTGAMPPLGTPITSCSPKRSTRPPTISMR